MLVFATLTLFLPIETIASEGIKWYSDKEGMVTGRIEKKLVMSRAISRQSSYCQCL